MALRLHDTLRDRIEAFSPLTPGHARVYVCGPTVYDYPHIGHMRVNVVYDVLVRHLRASGLQVTYVRNVTDIDDKIIKRAAELGEEPAALARRFTQAYHDDTARLFCVPPDVEPKVSEHLPEIVALIERLIGKGAAYAADGDVYFRVEAFPGYGKLSHRKTADLELGASGRVGDDEARRKQHAADFALWKGAKPGEPSWPSPWGPGRPGWHIECSAMCMRHLGESFDIHGGGLDLVFPHHENEIAQSEAVTGQPLVRFWVHNGFIEVNKEKMSKSLGNFFTARTCFAHVEPEALRYFMLTTHYRAPLGLDWTVDDAGQVTGFPQIEDAERRVEYLYSTRLRLAAIPADRIDAASSCEAELRDFGKALGAALDEDLNFPAALAVLADFLKRANDVADAASRKKGRVSQASIDAVQSGFEAVGRVLGLGTDDAHAVLRRIRSRRAKARGLHEADIEASIVARIEARKNREFARADEIRAQLLASGVELMDGDGGTDWRLP
jgi:cysteinyl-tRNA synthetase